MIPESYDGLRTGDVVCSIFGGSGDLFLHALSKRGENMGTEVYRITPFELKANRTRDKEEDALNVIELFLSTPSLFHHMSPRDRKIIEVAQAQKVRIETMKERIACEQRLYQRAKRMAYYEFEEFPEFTVEERTKALLANDIVYQNILTEEKARERELERAVKATDIWQEIFEPIEGIGWAIAARLISDIGTVSRFRGREYVLPPTEHRDFPLPVDTGVHKLVKYCGAHVLKDGTFPRRRRGEKCNWAQDTRQALWLLGDQFNRRPGSEWGKKFLKNKAKLREKHPEAVEVPIMDKETGKVLRTVKRYTDGHIHKMATWRTLTQFVRWLYYEWKKLEARRAFEIGGLSAAAA
jgi:hypothetical protein